MRIDIFDLAYEITNDILSELDPTDWEGMSDVIEGLVEDRLRAWLDDGKISLGS